MAGVIARMVERGMTGAGGTGPQGPEAGRGRAGPRPMVLCADDYALAPGVSGAIRELIAAGRLTATSCMALMPGWPAEAPALAALAGRADIGLHLTLTDHPPLGAMPGLAPGGRLPGLGALIARALARRIDRAEVAAELERQFDAFEAAFGRPPDHIDGHQHVHQLPAVREAVLDLRRRRAPGAYLRVCCEAPARILGRGAAARALVIDRLGRGLRRLARDAGVPANDGFAGVRDFSAGEDYPAMMRRWLIRPGPLPLAMCHPGRVDAELAAADPVTAPREAELAHLASDAFAADLAAAGLRLGRFAEVVSYHARHHTIPPAAGAA